MEENKQIAREILEIAKKIYCEIEAKKPVMLYEQFRSLIHSDTKYYFTYIGIDGYIEKKEDGYIDNGQIVEGDDTYAIIVGVTDNNSRGFAKIRIYDNGEINIKGTRTGSWQYNDKLDEDLTKSTDPELPEFLKIMLDGLKNFYKEIQRDCDKATKLHLSDFFASVIEPTIKEIQNERKSGRKKVERKHELEFYNEYIRQICENYIDIGTGELGVKADIEE